MFKATITEEKTFLCHMQICKLIQNHMHSPNCMQFMYWNQNIFGKHSFQFYNVQYLLCHKDFIMYSIYCNYQRQAYITNSTIVLHNNSKLDFPFRAAVNYTSAGYDLNRPRMHSILKRNYLPRGKILFQEVLSFS